MRENLVKPVQMALSQQIFFGSVIMAKIYAALHHFDQEFPLAYLHK
jgi:hypothetical protein